MRPAASKLRPPPLRIPNLESGTWSSEPEPGAGTWRLKLGDLEAEDGGWKLSSARTRTRCLRKLRLGGGYEHSIELLKNRKTIVFKMNEASSKLR